MRNIECRTSIDEYAKNVMRRTPLSIFFARTLPVAVFAMLAACDNKPTSPSPATAAPAELWKEFSGEKALEHVRKQVEFGPRPSGSPALEKARGHIIEELKAQGWEPERQEFDAEPVPGKGRIRYVNIIGRYPNPAKRDTQRVIMGSHYDTKKMEGFVGANDGGSSTGALLELARVLAQSPALATQVELVFFDGEEAVVEYNLSDPTAGPDGLVGSTYYATKLRDSERAVQMKFALIWDMIGDRNLMLTLPRDSPTQIAGGLFTTAEKLGLRNYIGYHSGSIVDDHVPIHRVARVPALDIIDLDYAPWHTVADTMSQLSPESLQIVGKITLWYLQRELSR
jgi:glutaminyl-peptide cyclotransferase